MKIKPKNIFLYILPWLILVLGSVVFLFLGMPEYQAYQTVSTEYDTSIKQLEQYQKNAEQTTVRKIVTILEKDYEQLQAEYDKIQKYLTGKYTFQWIDQYQNLSSLDFKNLIVEKRQELNRYQIGFEEFDTSIPPQEDVQELLRRLEISETLIKLFNRHSVNEISDIRINPVNLVNNDVTQEAVLIFSFWLPAFFDALPSA